jgi:hypothetical protein
VDDERSDSFTTHCSRHTPCAVRRSARRTQQREDVTAHGVCLLQWAKVTEVIRPDEEPVLKTGGGPAPLVGSSPTASARNSAWPSGGTGRRPTLRTSRPKKAWEFESPLGHRKEVPLALWERVMVRADGRKTPPSPPAPLPKGEGREPTRVSQCSTGPHKPGRPGATPGPATLNVLLSLRERTTGLNIPHAEREEYGVATGYANRHSGEVESLVPVGSTPTPVTGKR